MASFCVDFERHDLSFGRAAVGDGADGHASGDRRPNPVAMDGCAHYDGQNLPCRADCDFGVHRRYARLSRTPRRALLKFTL